MMREPSTIMLLPRDLWERLSHREREILAERLELQERQANQLRVSVAEETEPAVSFTLEAHG